MAQMGPLFLHVSVTQIRFRSYLLCCFLKSHFGYLWLYTDEDVIENDNRDVSWSEVVDFIEVVGRDRGFGCIVLYKLELFDLFITRCYYFIYYGYILYIR